MSDLTDAGAKTSVNYKRAHDFDDDDGPSESWHSRRRKCNIGLCDSRDSHSENYHLFFEIPERILKGVTRALERLLVDNFASRIVRLTSLKLLNCNAADPSVFKSAYCSVEPFENEFSLWSAFQKGTNLLMNFIDADPEQEARIAKIPGTKQEKLILDKLLHYLVEIDQQYQGKIESPLTDLEGKSEEDLTMILANHLFGKLATSSNYLLDKQNKEKEHGRKYQTCCPCGTSQCKLTGRFGDTRIGNTLVWHGSLDAIIDDQVILVTQEEEGELQQGPGGGSSVETQQEAETKISRYQQNIAKTITFSFLQKQRHPESEHFLIPCIGITDTDMVVYLYDSEHDVLLESSKIRLHESEGQTSLLAVIVAWLVVNYKYTCDGLTDEMKRKTAGFIPLAKSKLDIYEKHLEFGDIGNAFRNDSHKSSQKLVEESASVLRQKIERDRLKTLLKFNY